MASVEDLSRKYSSQLSQVRAIFPEWEDQDLLFALSDAKGSLEDTVLAISEGRASQFTQATRKKPTKSAPPPSGPKGIRHSNQNADSAGWDDVNAGEFGRPGRGGRGGMRGGRGGARGGRGGGDSLRGGRGGRGRGRGGFTNVNGHSTAAGGAATSASAGTDGWGATTTDGPADVAAEGEGVASTAAVTAPAAVAAGQADDFAAAAGWGDAPAAKELEKAAAQGGTSWQEEIKKPVPVAQPSAPLKKTWAQIAKPADKPKPAPLPPAAAKPAPPPPAKAEPAEAAPPAEEQSAAEPIDSFGDAPAQKEVEAAAAELAPEEPSTQPGKTDLLPDDLVVQPSEEPAAEGAWEDDAIVSGPGSKPWNKQAAAPAAASEGVTTYSSPPGFDQAKPVPISSVPGVLAQAQAQATSQPRTSSRAERRIKDSRGVVLPASMGGTPSMEMQFGSLSFGGEAGDGVEAPVPEVKTPAQQPVPLAAAAAKVASPIRAPQGPPSSVGQTASQIAPHAPAPAPPAVSAPAQASASPYYSQQPSAQAPAAAPAQAPQSSFPSHHQTLQAQMHHYPSNYAQQAQPQAAAPSQAQQQPPQSQYGNYRPNEYLSYGLGSQQPSAQQPAQTESQQNQPSQNQYDSAFGFGSYGQQGQQHTDAYASQGRPGYDSYPSYGRPAEEPKPTPPAAHTPSAPSQQVQGQQAQQHLPYGHQHHQQQSGLYPQYNQMSFYNSGPYNPYHQYGQGPQPGFQPYYPLAGRNLYGGHQQPPPPAQQQGGAGAGKPAAAQSPYSYPSSNYDDSLSSFGRYNSAPSAADTKSSAPTPASSQPAGGAGAGGAGGFGANYLGMSSGLGNAGRQNAQTPDEGYKSASAGGPGSRLGQPVPQQQGQQGQQQGQGQGGAAGQGQGQAQQAFGNYGGYGGAAAGGYGGYGDWSGYNQGRNGYAGGGWQQ